MNEINRKVLVGDNVKIKQKDGKLSVGMVRRVLRDFRGEVIVELFNGLTGHMIRILPKIERIPIRKIATKKIEQNLNLIIGIPRDKLYSGENNKLEYKASALWSQNLSREEIESLKTPEVKKYGNRASKIIIAKVIAGFLNSNGGNLIIGIKEEKNQNSKDLIVGIDSEFKLLKNKDFGEDGYKRMIMDDIIRPYFPKEIFNHFNNYLQINFIKKETKTLCIISIKKSDQEVFISVTNNEHFFIRVDTQTRELKGKEIIDYIRKHF